MIIDNEQSDPKIIDIAYDRKNGRFVAYNLNTNVFATGVCVESAVKAYYEEAATEYMENVHCKGHLE